ncbi:unnamed protein product [Rotaria sordida]|uniref:Uncharacterized protein n=1 Tax=Rotaria sordida TaxID=392033 RepID=A0A814I9U3_9BILA|nr:unnamed protein product [Rotaria sordida]CAF1642498.1 unnamed protein product [Rotaria sordida]
MPNLKHFYFQLLVQKSSWSFTNEYLNGYVWQQMFELYLQYLSKFEFHMTVTKRIPKLDLDFVIKSFNYFVQKYSNWDMIIDRWIYGRRLRDEIVILQTLNYTKAKLTGNINIPFITCRTFEIRSTRNTTNEHYYFYSNTEHLKLYIENEKCNITWSSSLFQNVTYLLVEGPIIKSSWLNYLYNIVNFRQTIDEENNAQEYVTYISHFVNLENVTKLKFRSTYSIDQWKNILFIFKACPNVIILIISTPLLLLSKLIDNSSLISIFKQIKMIKSVTERVFYFAAIFS